MAFCPRHGGEREGEILNVASTAGFMPGPTMAVYFATKSAVISFSAALAEELQGTGVKVSALCPGAVKTGFQARAKMTASPYARGNRMDPAAVARFGYESLKKGEAHRDSRFQESSAVSSPALHSVSSPHEDGEGNDGEPGQVRSRDGIPRLWIIR